MFISPLQKTLFKSFPILQKCCSCLILSEDIYIYILLYYFVCISFRRFSYTIEYNPLAYHFFIFIFRFWFYLTIKCCTKKYLCKQMKLQLATSNWRIRATTNYSREEGGINNTTRDVPKKKLSKLARSSENPSISQKNVYHI